MSSSRPRTLGWRRSNKSLTLVPGSSSKVGSSPKPEVPASDPKQNEDGSESSEDLAELIAKLEDYEKKARESRIMKHSEETASTQTRGTDSGDLSTQSTDDADSTDSMTPSEDGDVRRLRFVPIRVTRSPRGRGNDRRGRADEEASPSFESDTEDESINAKAKQQAHLVEEVETQKKDTPISRLALSEKDLPRPRAHSDSKSHVSIVSPRDLFTVHVSEEEKRTIVWRGDLLLRAVVERICFVRSWEVRHCSVTTMEGIQIKMNTGVTLADLPVRHVRLSHREESKEEARDRLRAFLKNKADKTEGFLDYTEEAPSFVQKEIVEFKAIPKLEKPPPPPLEKFAILMGETNKQLFYQPDKLLLPELEKICHSRSWSLADRIVLTMKGKLLEPLAGIKLGDIKERQIQFLGRDEVKPVSSKMNKLKRLSVGGSNRASKFVNRQPSPPPTDSRNPTPRDPLHRFHVDSSHVSSTKLGPVLSHPHSNFMTLGTESSIEGLLPQMLQMLEVADIYADHFIRFEHENYIGEGLSVGDEPQIFSVRTERTTKGFLALKVNKQGSEEFFIPHDLLEKSNASLRSRLKDYLEARYNLRLLRIKNPVALHQLGLLEKEHRQDFSSIKLGFLLAKNEQTDPLKMFRNQPTPAFQHFLSSVFSVKHELKHTHHSSWRERSVLLYLAPKMDDEQHRRIIGNVTNVIIFHDISSPTAPPLDPTEMHTLGSVPQLFTVVRPVYPEKGSSPLTPEELANPIGYRVGTFRRTSLKESGPPGLIDYVFRPEELKEYLMIKHYNALMMMRISPPICRLYQVPRLAAIENIVDLERHGSKSLLTSSSSSNLPALQSSPSSSSVASIGSRPLKSSSTPYISTSTPIPSGGSSGGHKRQHSEGSTRHRRKSGIYGYNLSGTVARSSPSSANSSPPPSPRSTGHSESTEIEVTPPQEDVKKGTPTKAPRRSSKSISSDASNQEKKDKSTAKPSVSGSGGIEKK